MGRYSRILFTVDTHTGGQPTRVVVGGMPRLAGGTMLEKMLDMQRNHDDIRCLITSEPRGTKTTSAVILTEPAVKEADFGAFYFERHGYMPMCGHDTIGLGTMLVETGMVKVQEPITRIVLDTPAGLVHLSVSVCSGAVRSVSFQNAACFVYETNCSVELDGRSFPFDIAYGGNFYAIFDALSFPVALAPENHAQLKQLGVRLMERINDRYHVVHPESDSIHGVEHVMFTDPIVVDGDRLLSRNAVVFLPGDIDRSPCGTGTSARAALLYDQGILKKGQTLYHRSLIDSEFSARIDVETTSSGRTMVYPVITGSAKVMGFGTILLDPADEMGCGFSLE